MAASGQFPVSAVRPLSNLLRAAGAAASTRHATARWATLQTHLVAVPARVASTARRLVLHLPKHWPWAPAWQDLWANATT